MKKTEAPEEMRAETSFRPATAEDLAAIIEMLADDPLGSERENFADPLPAVYPDAFHDIESDPNNELVVVEREAVVIGVFQLTFIPYLTYQGGWRALVEGVRVARSARSAGIGELMFKWAISRAKERGCILIQLTTDKSRPDAVRFYEKLGFAASHEGMKLRLK